MKLTPPCPQCSSEQTVCKALVEFDEQKDGKYRMTILESLEYECKNCGAEWEE